MLRRVGGKHRYPYQAQLTRQRHKTCAVPQQKAVSSKRAFGQPTSYGKYGIIVEGHGDRKAVQSALDAKVFVLGSSTSTSGSKRNAVKAALQAGLQHLERIYVLTDPDVAGRQARMQLEEMFPTEFWHAFVPAHLATSPGISRWHGAGNVGIEHVRPENIILALHSARQASPGRQTVTRDTLKDIRLAAEFGDLQTGEDIARRRRAVCDRLGIGDCNAKQLLRQLNTFGFSDAELREASESLDLS